MSEEPQTAAASGEPFKLTPQIVILSISVILAMTLQSLDANIVNVALPHMRGNMSASPDQIAWVLTSYVVAAAVCTLLTGFLVQRFGRKRVMLCSVACFTITSMLCGVAVTLEQIVLFRLLQGAGGAFLQPLSQAIVMELYPREKLGVVMGVWSMGVMLAPILGPTIGGYLTELYSWRWAFFINVPLGILSMIGIARLLTESQREPDVRFDLLGYMLIATSLGAFQLMLDRGTMLDWFSSMEIVLAGALAALTFYIFVVHMLTADRPFLSREPFKDVNYVVGVCITFMFVSVTFAMSAILPTMLQSLLGYPSLTAGEIMVPRGLGAIISMGAAGRLLKYVDGRLLVAFGSLVSAATLWQLSLFSLDVGAADIEWNGFFQGLGMGFIAVPMTTLSFTTLSSRYVTESAAVFGLLRNFGTAVGISITTTMITRMTQANHALLTEHLTPFSAPLKALPLTVVEPGVRSVAVLEGEITRQASMIAYINLYRGLAYFSLATAVLLLLIRMPKTTQSQPDSLVVAEV
jgi:DHA2 family multidrug resistance protein